jgi:NitT/TauT family transport system permease protein
MRSAGKIDTLAASGAVRTAPLGLAQSVRLQSFLSNAFWWLASVALFAGLWEAAWMFGWANPMLLPPPHIFLHDFFAQGKFFNPKVRMSDASPGVIALAVATTVAYSTLRVLIGLALGFAISVSVGMAIRYAPLLGKLVMPIVLLLAPVSPVAWMPVALFVFGIGNAPAIFLVVIALFFIMTLATVSMIDAVSPTYLDVARIMGATRRQIFFQVILPAILPGLFLILRLNLFAAWMIVLIAELIGVGSGLGQVVMVARNTFNSQLAFFAMTVIGLTGFILDVALREIQRRLLYWIPQGKGTLLR